MIMHVSNIPKSPKNIDLVSSEKQVVSVLCYCDMYSKLVTLKYIIEKLFLLFPALHMQVVNQKLSSEQ